MVASEVRQLAGRSASAAREIKELIEDSVSKVKDGTAMVTSSGDELQEISNSVSQLTELVGQITNGSDEQVLGIEQINQALLQIDEVIPQNAALFEKATATSGGMRAEALKLSEQIGYFSINNTQSDSRTTTDDPVPTSIN